MDAAVFYTVVVLVVIALTVVTGRRSDAQGRRRIWISALVVTALGLLALACAVLGAWGLVYLSAIMLLIGLPIAILFTAWVYADKQDPLLDLDNDWRRGRS